MLNFRMHNDDIFIEMMEDTNKTKQNKKKSNKIMICKRKCVNYCTEDEKKKK